MAVRTVRLDDETEATLRQIREATGMPISEALKQGLRSLHRQVKESSRQRPFDIYQNLDLGPGGYASVPSTDTRRGVIEALRKRIHHRGSRSVGHAQSLHARPARL